jgi:PAS domain S-box-containing protein
MTRPRESEALRIQRADSPREKRIDARGLGEIWPALMDSLSDAVVVIDHEWRVVAANQRYVDEFGTRRSRVVGGPCDEVLKCPEAAETGGHAQCSACLAWQGHSGVKIVRQIPGPNGVPRRWEASFSPIRDGTGQVTHVVEVWRDISERSALEAQLAHSERLASIGTLAAGVAHELNNPLASVLAGVDSLTRALARHASDPSALDEAAALLALLEKEIGRCRDTTQKLVQLAQPYTTSPSLVDVNRAVEDTLSLLAFQARRQGVIVEERLAEALPNVIGSDSGIRSVCMNLMMNAIQAMPGGGVLGVETRSGNGVLAIVVEDTGHGIPVEHLERIWEPFFSTKPAGQGTGLGLFVTNGVVASHGGTVRSENRAGGGARFTVELPFGSLRGDIR